MTNTTEAALRDAINVLRQIGSMEARTHAQRHWFAEARRIAALSQPSPATTAWTIEQARELDAALIQTARNLAGACGATQSEMREARAEFLRDWLNNNISQPSPASSTAGEGADALAKAFCLLDSFAGDGLGHVYGNGQTIDADDTVFELCEAFGMEPEPGWWRRLAASLSPSSGEPASVAVEADVERGTVERMAYGYELMFRAICNIAGTSGERESWYRQQANEMLERVVPLHSLRADSNPHKPGDCLTQYKRFGAAVEQESLEHFAIRVEKLLCEKLGREWTATGISIASLVDELSALSKPTPVEAGLREEWAKLIEGVTPELLNGKASVKGMTSLLEAGALNQKPKSRQASRGEFNAEADARFILACVNHTLADLSETQPPRETSTQEKQNG